MEAGGMSASQVRIGDNSIFRQGDNFYGPVTVLNKGPMEGPPSSADDIPDLLSPHFAGRDDELGEIRDAFHQSKSDAPIRCIIYGMPGLGKTQVALKYAELALEEKRYPYIFWISAASIDKLIQGFSKLLDLIVFAGRAALDQTARCVAARGWLEDGESEVKRRWLLVLDNVDQETVAKLREMLPRRNTGGRILMTTRTKQTAEALATAFSERHVYIGLRTFSVGNAVRLFLRTVETGTNQLDPEDLRQAEDVVRSVGCLPLAVDQAASLLEVSGDSVHEIADIYRSEQVESALEWENDLSRYEEKSVMATYASTLIQLERSPPGTGSLLRVLTFLDPESISIDMLKDGYRATTLTVNESEKSVQDLLNSTIDLSRALQYLQRLSLVVSQKEGQIRTLRLHDLVQLVLRTKLMSNADERKRWLEHTIRIICKAFEKIEDPRSPSCWDQCEVFVAHTRALLRYGDTHGVDSIKLWKTCSWIASYFWAHGRYEEAITVDKQILAKREEHLGAEHADTLSSINNLASTYWNQGRWTEAETLQVQVMETSKRVLGAEHPDTLSSIANLASTYLDQGRWTEAEMLQVQVIETSKRVLGAEHPDTLRSIANLASTYLDQGRWTEAETLQVQVMETSKRVLGAEHPDTLSSINNLASTYLHQGRWTEAETLQVQVMETSKRVLGAEHPDTLRSMTNLASTYLHQGRWTEAETLQVQVMETRKRVLGAEHPDTLRSIANLASTYWNQGRWTEAETLQVQVMETSKRVLGAEHPDTLRSMTNLASTYWNQGRWTEAETLQVQVMETRKRVLGAEHPDTLTSMKTLAYTHRSLGRHSDALCLMQETAQKLNQRLGLEHPNAIAAR